MTPLTKRVARVTTREHGEKIGLTGRLYGKQRKLVAALLQGDLLALKPLGCGAERTIYFDLGELYRKGLIRDAFIRKMKKAEEKKSRKR